jgi:hypothetical protein
MCHDAGQTSNNGTYLRVWRVSGQMQRDLAKLGASTELGVGRNVRDEVNVNRHTNPLRPGVTATIVRTVLYPPADEPASPDQADPAGIKPNTGDVFAIPPYYSLN